jgi:hypothetical protein
MSELDTLTEQFERLLEGIHGKHTLEEWRYAYRKVVYFGAMKILGDFPGIILGPAPLPVRSGKGRGPVPAGATTGPVAYPVIAGQQPPYRPSDIGELLCIALGNCHQPT